MPDVVPFLTYEDEILGPVPLGREPSASQAGITYRDRAEIGTKARIGSGDGRCFASISTNIRSPDFEKTARSGIIPA